MDNVPRKQPKKTFKSSSEPFKFDSNSVKFSKKTSHTFLKKITKKILKNVEENQEIKKITKFLPKNQEKNQINCDEN